MHWFFLPHSLAGIRKKKQRQSPWIPACAGMTNKTAPPRRDRSRPVPTLFVILISDPPTLVGTCV